MSINATIAVLYAQTGYTARAAHDASTGPQAALAMSRAMATEMAKLEQQQVQSVDPSVESRVTDDEDSGQDKQSHYGSRRRNRPPPLPTDSMEPTMPDTPLVGNLLNIKV